MGQLVLPDLDEALRRTMLEELDADIASGAVMESRVALPGSAPRYLEALRDAFRDGDAITLAGSLIEAAMFADRDGRGASVNPGEAAHRLADGQFIHYYARAVCRRAIELGLVVEYYRAENTAVHRPETDAVIGTVADPDELLSALRSLSLEPWRVGHLGKPNSGLCVRVASHT